LQQKGQKGTARIVLDNEARRSCSSTVDAAEKKNHSANIQANIRESAAAPFGTLFPVRFGAC
jgi:hypothetical protein